MRSPTPNHAFARKLRSELSLPEKLIWVRIRGREPGRPVFRRQHPVRPYVLDFYCATARLCVEIDGQGHGFGDQPARDERRDAFLHAIGIDVVRIPASTVLDDPETVVEWMWTMARERMARAASAPSV
ncbi:MAG: endonuclease domain-containing protein [Alphaproteobacteria bacterium]|nr:endonuclease domain-containing protein [Alphaproteobacteria bacterium]MBU1515615.1 endonuclease domain-containing protein [Alphaproteobacteria bacterium]MBU2096950.1 endonuclease domain-containing protein [Alphaproteobacteria bacterium]MBU2149605.1 endonuclease domain-containing protein [Alphaproteobacteria bacterium]MBU2305659.1 endonuclease domain-containing protein [Alphaproteobacteria bacterium]